MNIIPSAIRNELNVLFANIEDIRKRYAGRVLESTFSVSLYGAILEQVRHLKSILMELDEVDRSSAPLELVVEIAMPESYNSRRPALLTRHNILYPYSRHYRQHNRIVADGCCRAYRIDIPEGTVGFINLVLKCDDMEGHEPLEIRGDEYVQRVYLEQGSLERPYSLGTILMAPLPGFPAPS
ncbi:MAG TPA: hypothetical protein VI756_03080 [Blastocatellia bacterium]